VIQCWASSQSCRKTGLEEAEDGNVEELLELCTVQLTGEGIAQVNKLAFDRV
jgi:hypothetical protein